MTAREPHPSANQGRIFLTDRAPGYRLVGGGPDHWRVRNFTTLHELFRVYVDSEGTLRTDHTVSFLGITIIRLHYKMLPSAAAVKRELSKNERIPTAQSVLNPMS